MKVRKLAVALALAGGLGSSVAQALGLGEIELQSYLNQPLNAEIDIRRAAGVDPNQIIVNLASERAYERVGLTRNYFLTRLDFNVTTDSNGELVIRVTTDEPVKEPYLSFLVEVTWPSGRVMREYSVLVDPPVYAEGSRAPEPVQAARTRSSAPAPRSEPRQQRQTTRETSRTSAGPRTLGPVTASDTLWELARGIKPDSSVSVQQVMLALQDRNPDAFMDGNINRLKRGAVLRVPDIELIRSRSQAQANREVAQQNQALTQPERELDATDSAVADDGTGSGGQQAAGSTDELRLVVPDGDASRSEGSAGGDGRQGGTADAGRAIALEELDRVQRENEELDSRMADLQDQVETLQRLIELKDSQLAEMQAAAGDEGEPTPQETSSGVSGSEASVSGEPATSEPAGDADTGMDQDATVEPRPNPDVVGADAGSTDPEGAETGTPDGTMDTEAPGEPGEVPAENDTLADPTLAPTDAQTGTAEPQPSMAPEQSFLDRAIELITGNVLYQVALGAFLVLLLLLMLLVSRRRGNKENEFYQQIENEPDDEEDDFELSPSDAGDASGGDALDEADRYIAYGQHDTAAEVLESAISREPSRSDLRLKLLAVYADTGNRGAFDKQYAELEAMDLDEAIPEAEALRARLEDVESTPSIDELESQLRGDRDFAASGSTDAERSPELMQDQYEARQPEPGVSDPDDLMASFEELDLPEDQEDGADELAETDKPIEFDLTGLDDQEAQSGTSDSELPDEWAERGGEDALDAGIDFELPREQGTEPDVSDRGGEEPLDPEDSFGSLELDDAGFDSEPEAEDVEGSAEVTSDDRLNSHDNDLEEEELSLSDATDNPEDEAELDESFLDELDAELDRVASEDDTAGPIPAGDGESDGLDDLELDVSDEDLALMDEVSETESDNDSDELSLDGLDFEDDETSGTGTGEAEQDFPLSGDDDLSDFEIPELEDDMLADSNESGPGTAGKGGDATNIDGIDEASLDDEDDFDFLSGTDEVATKLDLARAYVDMGDSEGAREILEEVILEGSDDQKGEAQSLLKKLP